MKGKLTPKESSVLYGVWIVAAFALFLLGLYWGKGQATGIGQEITTQQVGAVPPGVLRRAPPVQTRLDLATKEIGPAVRDQQAPPDSPVPGAGPAVPEVKTPSAAPAASAQPVAKPPLSAPSAGKERFSIQVGALKTEEEAQKVITRLETRGYTGILDKPVSARDPFYRVRVGSYSSREDAARAETLLKAAGFLTFVKKIGPTGR